MNRPVFGQDIPLSSIEMHPDHGKSLSHDEWEDLRLFQSVEEFGILEPLIVNHVGGGRYVLVDGHRRFACARELDIESVLCTVHMLLTPGEMEKLRFTLHQTCKPWTQAEYGRAVKCLEAGIA